MACIYYLHHHDQLRTRSQSAPPPPSPPLPSCRPQTLPLWLQLQLARSVEVVFSIYLQVSMHLPLHNQYLSRYVALEFRNHIYEYVAEYSIVLCARPSDANGHSGISDWTLPAHRSRGLAQTCQQLYREFQPILCQHTALSMSYPDSAAYINTFGNDGRSFCKAITVDTRKFLDDKVATSNFSIGKEDSLGLGLLFRLQAAMQTVAIRVTTYDINVNANIHSLLYPPSPVQWQQYRKQTSL